MSVVKIPLPRQKLNKLLIFSVAYFCIYPLFHLSK
nr:MAG TPA: N-terminal domain of cytochrome oxidase-cbb3, FixP [Caudoviricetes sp.]